MAMIMSDVLICNGGQYIGFDRSQRTNKIETESSSGSVYMVIGC